MPAGGNLYGAGNALNMLVFNEPDLATQLRLLQQALVDFEATGYVERQGSSPATSASHIGILDCIGGLAV